MSCGWRGPMPGVLDRVRAGEEDPPCRRCGGILKSATISFGQALEPDVIRRAMRAASEADVLLAVGSTLQVYPVAGAVPAAKEAGARVVIVNAEPTPFDDIADAVLSRPIGEALPLICRTSAEPARPEERLLGDERRRRRLERAGRLRTAEEIHVHAADLVVAELHVTGTLSLVGLRRRAAAQRARRSPPRRPAPTPRRRRPPSACRRRSRRRPRRRREISSRASAC